MPNLTHRLNHATTNFTSSVTNALFSHIPWHLLALAGEATGAAVALAIVVATTYAVRRLRRPPR